jgi:hypothetical protein
VEAMSDTVEHPILDLVELVRLGASQGGRAGTPDGRPGGQLAIDDDLWQEYWLMVRKRPGLAAQTSLRLLGQHAKHSTR